jgi:hypothetical protein
VLGLKTKEVLRYHREYFMLLGSYEFTKVYLQIKDNPWAYVNLVKLAQNSARNSVEQIAMCKNLKDLKGISETGQILSY